MKYLAEENTVNVGIREFVSIARRSISPIPPKDECEPTLTEASRISYKIAKIDKSAEREISRMEAS